MKPRKPKSQTPQQAAFVERFLATGNGMQSAKDVGVSPKSAKKMSYRWLNKTPAVKEVVAQARKEVAEKIKYTAEVAMNEANEAIQFAKETGNANAYVKAVELRSKLQGLLIEKHDVRQVGFSIRIDGVGDPSAVISTTGKKTEDDDDDIFG